MPSTNLYMITFSRGDQSSGIYRKIDLIEEMSFFSKEIMSISISEDTKTIWVVMLAESESELVHKIHKVSFVSEYEYEYTSLALNQSTTHYTTSTLPKI